MVGKGQRRREKNYRAAHGGYTRLPPPPKASEIDALPSKLRKLIDFTSSASSPTTKGKVENSADTLKNKKKDAVKGEKKLNNDVQSTSKSSNSNKETTKDGKELKSNKQKIGDVETVNEDQNDKKKGKKRKREQIKDRRFDTTLELGSYGSKKRERRKKHAEAKKKKHKKGKIEEAQEFPRHEEIKFGDVVDAPPKLLAVPKASKKIQGASNERLRLQAVESYRNRKGWGSRPGIHLPPPIVSNLSV